ncbi:MAG: hypothetical protein WD336_06215 [Trueperaceae bacterium]
MGASIVTVGATGTGSPLDTVSQAIVTRRSSIAVASDEKRMRDLNRFVSFREGVIWIET